MDPLDEPRHISYDVTIRSPFATSTLRLATASVCGAAEAGNKDKLATFARSIRSAYSLADSDPLPDLPWTFAPLSFDTLGAPSTFAAEMLKPHAKLIAKRCYSTLALVHDQIRQKLSFTIWSSVANAIRASIPMRGSNYLDVSLYCYLYEISAIKKFML